LSFGRSEGFSLLREWFSDKALLRSELRFSGGVATVRGRISELSGEFVRLLSDDNMTGEVAVHMAESSKVDFGWGISVLPGHGRVLVITFGLEETGPADSVAFAEIKS
jgi:hypothetical protein